MASVKELIEDQHTFCYEMLYVKVVENEMNVLVALQVAILIIN